MNSALQCLSNIECFREYLLSMSFKDEINLANVLGTQGEVISQLAKLFYQMWNKAYQSSNYWSSTGFINPGRFKKIFSKHNIMFEGYEQHDSAEFLA